MKNNSIEGCPSVLTWLPEKSYIWKTYGNRMGCLWKLIIGRRSTWNQLEIILKHPDLEFLVFSPDSIHIMTVQYTEMGARIWNITTGECEAELKERSEERRVGKEC